MAWFTKVKSDKVVLLLGAEKEGLAAELIQLCDVCVEIPQAGMIRSLNVHVTGAICMFEYVRAAMAREAAELSA